MKKPNQELFRIVRFAIKFPGWHTYGSDVRKHVYRAGELGFLDVVRETKQFRLKLPERQIVEIPEVKPVIKVHWANPWTDVIPVPIEELAECHAGLGGLCYSASVKGNFLLTSESVLEMWRSAGDKLDAYILPEPSGFHSIGIRYGNEDQDYLSPHGDKEKVQALLDKYNLP